MSFRPILKAMTALSYVLLAGCSIDANIFSLLEPASQPGPPVLESPITFGENGYTRFKMRTGGDPSDNDGKAVAIQADGKILIGGYATVIEGEDFGLIRLNPDGSIDTSFATNGKWTYAPGVDNYDTILDMTLQSDNKILAAGISNDSNNKSRVALLRLLPNGTPDNTFGTAGFSYINFAAASESEGKKLFLLPDGKILVAGTSYVSPYNQVVVARFNANGTLDTTFNSGAGYNILTIAGRHNDVDDLKVDNLGRIIVGGYTWPSGDLAGMIARLTADGDLDTTFGGTGIVITNRSVAANDNIQSVHPLSDGSILVAGSITIAGDSDFFVSKYTVTGTIDNTFNGTGIAQVNNGLTDSCRSMQVASDGSIFLFGNSSGNMVVAKLTAAVGLDASFGAGGLTSADITGNNDYDYAADSALLSDGRLVVIGYTYLDTEEYSIARFNPDGTMDTTLNGTGTGFYDIDGDPYDDIWDILLQADGKILIGGTSEKSDEGSFAVKRLNTNGSFDATFGASGTATTTPVSGRYSLIKKMHLLANGKILAAGTDYDQFILARYLANGSLDTSFAAGAGIALTEISAGNGERVSSMLVQADGKIIVTGSYNNDLALVRYSSEGILDTSFGSSGISVLDLGVVDEASTAYELADGKLLVAGVTQDKFMLLRLNADGTLDTSFASGAGYVTTDVGATSHGFAKMAVLPDGHIILAGQADTHIGIVKYNSDGTLAATFANSGSAILTIPGSTSEVFKDLALQSDGKILIVGAANTGGLRKGLILQLDSAGILDSTFGTSGVILEQPSAESFESELSALAVAPDDSFYAAGLQIKHRNYSVVYKYGKNGTR